ncbi:MAG: hypothetical protein M0P01_09935 [Treponema sp.]|nr:hypothetical protein [Treponema sp.]
MKRLHFLLLSAAVIVSAVFCSCTGTAGPTIRTESVTFTLPVWPPEDMVPYPPLLYWDIQFCSGNLSGTCRVFVQDTADTSFSIKTEADIPCAVTAQPVTRIADSNQAFFSPAGCIYPAESTISWENGFPAAVCMQLYRSSETDAAETSVCLANFNWKKFCSTLAAKETAYGAEWNPWMLDKTAVCTAIAARSFGAALLTVKNYFSIKAEILTHRTDTGMQFIPRYIPLFKRQRETETILLRKGAANFYLYNMQQIAIITGTGSSNLTLEITSVPLYTQK